MSETPSSFDPGTPVAITGWDIGGVHLKAARLRRDAALATASRPFSIQHEMPDLANALRALHAELVGTPGELHAVTMTAELSQRFRLKRDGVIAVLDAVEAAFPKSPIRVFAVDGRFLTPAAARLEPLAVAASNWAATARWLARSQPDVLLLDMGSTTTDIIPIVHGRVAALGATDPERMRHGELIYTGMVRTPVEAVIGTVPWQDARVRVSADGFALTGDVHLWLGALTPSDYTTPAPDSRSATRVHAGERLARIICGDRELVNDAELDAIARAVAEAQVNQIVAGIRQVLARHPEIRRAAVTGLGEPVAAAAARQAGLEVHHLSDSLGVAAARIAPAAAVANLMQGCTDSPRTGVPPASREIPSAASHTELTVMKVGGGVSAVPGGLSRVGAAIGRTAEQRRVVVLPGGGPFADQVRTFDAEWGLSPDAAHWMAILAMDQYAFALADHIACARVVEDRAGIQAALAEGKVPVLAPSRWLRAADELPHSWDVTSDSLAAYLAMLMGADRLVLIKPVSGGRELLDPHFDRALPAGMPWTIVGMDDLDRLG
jgi:probable H4MPT-linked C1 transfer pathway protein